MSAMHTKTASWAGKDKAEELARLQDFFGKLARGEHRSLYEESIGLRNMSLGDSSSSSSETESEGSERSPESTPATSPASSMSALPDKSVDSALSKVGDERQMEPPRGRTQIRDTKTGGSLTYDTQWPEGAYSHQHQHLDETSPMPPAPEEPTRKGRTGGRAFTFKMMLHELYEDVESFRTMVRNVLEESRSQFKPLAGSSFSSKGKEKEQDTSPRESDTRAAKKRRVVCPDMSTGSVEESRASISSRAGSDTCSSRGELGIRETETVEEDRQSVDGEDSSKKSVPTEANGGDGSETVARRRERGGREPTPVRVKRRLSAC